MRRLVPDDAANIAELDLALFPDNCFNERTLLKEIEEGEGWIIHLFHGEPIAYAVTRSKGGLRDLLRIGVRVDKQGRGYGQALLKEAI